MKPFFRSDTERIRREVDDERSLRTQAERETARLAAALDAVPIGLVLVDESGRTVVRNQAAAIGGHGDVLINEAVQRLLSRAVEGVADEKRLDLFGPPAQVLMIRGVPLPGFGALAVIDDLSERARLDAVRTDFVANISHELKTPVGALAVLAEALADSDDEAVNSHLANKMVEEAHRASRTIDDLLDLSRIELGGRGEPEEVLVSAILNEVVGRHRFHADHESVRLETIPAGNETVVGDRLQLVSALSNLVDNAIKYTNAGGTVKVHAKSTDQWVEFEVCDTGVGIPTRDLDRVFERFYRVDRARSRKTGGTGLGLAIVRHVAANHGGEVAVRSREGEGSTFTLRIPRPEAS